MSCSLYNSRKRHSNALQDPEVRAMLRFLKMNWKKLTAWERGEDLINLVLCGCSASGLAEHLPCSASTITRLMDVADLMLYLTDDEYNAILQGAPFGPFLEGLDEQKVLCRMERQPRFIQALAETQANAAV